MNRNAVILAVLAAPLPLACAETLMETPAPIKVKDARNCYRLSPELYRSGQPGGDGFKALEKLGLKSVLNLREYHSDADEAEQSGTVPVVGLVDAIKIVKAGGNIELSEHSKS